jgi:hypothetical protein
VECSNVVRWRGFRSNPTPPEGWEPSLGELGSLPLFEGREAVLGREVIVYRDSDQPIFAALEAEGLLAEQRKHLRLEVGEGLRRECTAEMGDLLLLELLVAVA